MQLEDMHKHLFKMNTRVEIDKVDQKENGYPDGLPEITYTLYLYPIDELDCDYIDSFSIDDLLDENDVEAAFSYFAKRINELTKQERVSMFKSGQRVEVVKPKLSWDGKRTMAKVGQTGTIATDESHSYYDYPIRIFLDGHRKGIWISPSCLKVINNSIK